MTRSTKTALVAGTTATSATGLTLAGITTGLAAPTANLGGYATAQIVAAKLGVAGGPALSSAIAGIGGPVVAGALASTGIGLVAGLGAYGLWKLLH